MPNAKPSGPLPTRHVPSLAPKADRATPPASTDRARHAVGHAAQSYENGASRTSPDGGDWLAELDRKPK